MTKHVDTEKDLLRRLKEADVAYEKLREELRRAESDRDLFYENWCCWQAETERVRSLAKKYMGQRDQLGRTSRRRFASFLLVKRHVMAAMDRVAGLVRQTSIPSIFNPSSHAQGAIPTTPPRISDFPWSMLSE